MRRSALLALLPPLLAALAGCASTDVEIQPLAHPYKVVLLPVEGAESALAGGPPQGEFSEGGEVPFALSPEQLRATIRDGIVRAGVFSRVVVADASDLVTDEFVDAVAAAAPLARRERADLIMRVRVNSARMQDLGPNGSKIWSTITWFLIPAPVWLVDDRTYSTSLTVQAELFDPADPVKPTASIVATSDEQELDLWDRGLEPLVILVPPPWLKGDAETVSVTLTERTVAQLMTELVEELRTREIPSRFDLDVRWIDDVLVLDIGSRRQLRSLDVLAGDATVRTWIERETLALVDDAASEAGRTVYRVRIPAAEIDAAVEFVRIVATDEAGGREVRTLPARPAPPPAEDDE